MLDFTAVNEEKMTLSDLVANLTRDDLRDLTNEMVDKMQSMIAECTDHDVTFEPVDPDAHDRFAKDPDEEDLAWKSGAFDCTRHRLQPRSRRYWQPNWPGV